MNRHSHIDGVVKQHDFSIKYVTDIVTELVKDTALATQVNNAIKARMVSHRDAFSNRLRDEEGDCTVELV